MTLNYVHVFALILTDADIIKKTAEQVTSLRGPMLPRLNGVIPVGAASADRLAHKTWSVLSSLLGPS